MRAVATVEPSIEPTELLSWDEICARFPGEWVILVEMVERDWDIAGGRVFAHCAERAASREPLGRAIRRYGGAGRFWTGHGAERRWKFQVDARRDV